MLRLDRPEDLDFTKPQEWLEWKQRFECFGCATELSEEDEVLQINALVCTMGMEAEHIFKAFTFTSGNEKKLCQGYRELRRAFCTEEERH